MEQPAASEPEHPYASRAYARALADSASLLALPEVGLHVLLRPLPDGEGVDAAGCYPVAPVDPSGDWPAAFERLRDAGAVSLVLVTDVLIPASEAGLKAVFDRVRPFKTHQLVELDSGDPRFSKHHRQEIRRAQRVCETRTFSLRDELDAWGALYAGLVSRHGIRGLRAFSAAHFEALARLDGLVAVGAWVDGVLASAHLWLHAGARAWSHLAASSEAGYAAGAAYAVHDHALRGLAAAGARVVDLGGAAGSADEGGGLDFFKRGFATHTERNFLCGQILDPERYADLCHRHGSTDGFFPAYRSPEATGGGGAP